MSTSSPPGSPTLRPESPTLQLLREQGRWDEARQRVVVPEHGGGRVVRVDEHGEWRTVPDVEGLEVSSMGFIRKDEGWRHGWCAAHKPKPDVHGYCLFTHQKKVRRVHDCVCLSFRGARPRPNDTPDHGAKYDGDKVRERSDNRACNLQWASKSQQNRNQCAKKPYRSGKPVLLRHIDAPEHVPWTWYPSALAAGSAIGQFGSNVSCAANGKSTRAGEYRVRWAPDAEPQHDLENEEWIQIDASTRVSSCGRAQIKLKLSSQQWRPIFTPVSTDGEPYARLRNKDFHVIVCTAFHGCAPSDNHTVDHVDQDESNNRASNLRWLDKAGQNANRTLQPKGPGHMDSRKR